jgi:hypothetical protein
VDWGGAGSWTERLPQQSWREETKSNESVKRKENEPGPVAGVEGVEENRDRRRCFVDGETAIE